jgi:hypothetical protein
MEEEEGFFAALRMTGEWAYATFRELDASRQAL